MTKLFRDIVIWTLAISLALPIAFVAVPPQRASAAVTNNGVFFFGDTSNAGQLKIRTFTNPSTYGAEVATLTSSASNIVHLVAKTAPTREEMIIGHLKVDGRLDIVTCTTGCDASADFTARWNNPGTTATQDCDNAPTLDTCTRAFDLGYEALSGRAFVAYADNVADLFYYARWDGSAWSPNATPGTPGASNEVNLPGTAGTPKWIRVVPAGDNLSDDRSNRVIVLVSDSNADLHAFYWDGSTFDAGTTLFSTLGLCDRAQCFDGNWQGNNTFVVSYTNAGVNEVRYQKYTVGTGWSGDAQAYATASAPMWITSVADPTSSRIYVANASQAEDTRAAVWRADDATDGWTVCASGGCPDTTTEFVEANIAYPAFERFNGEAIHHYLDQGNGTAATSGYFTYTPTSTWSIRTVTGMTPTDDYMQVKAVPSPNSDDIMLMALDVDCDWDAQMWDGSALATAGLNLELLISSTNNLCANPTPIEGMSVGYAYDFAWKIYTPWQRNWRWTNGETDTASTPTTSLAAENTTPTGITDGQNLRLRINYAERGATTGEVDARKKLQWTTGCNPNTSLETTCTWTDVDNAAGAGTWRYVDLTCSPTDCADDTVLTGTVLTGTGACSAGNGCGTWVLNKDGATFTNMDHNANQVQESEWIIESNGATPGATYYFRIYNTLISGNGQDTPIYREQDANDCGAGAAQCTYPSLTMRDFQQAAYRWFANADSVDPGSALAAQDTSATLTSTGQEFRLRMLLHVAGGQLALNGENFKLQLAVRSGTCDTGFSGETYSDVATASGDIRYFNNATPADGDNLNAAFSDGLSHGGDTINAQDYEEANNFTNSVSAIPSGQDGKWDFALDDFSAPGNTTYCFRIVKSDGSLLETYSVIPQITTFSVGPTTEDIMRHGNWFNAGVEQSFFWAQ